MISKLHAEEFTPLRWVCSAHPTEQKIREFELFEVGWHFGIEGRRFTGVAVEEAIELHSQLLFAGFSQTDAFPGLSGEIQITAYWEEDFYEFTREANGRWTYVHEQFGEEKAYREQLSREEVHDLVERLCPRLCNTFVFYPGTNIGIGEAKDLARWHSSPPARTAESPFLSMHVVSTPPVRFVTTSGSFIPWYPATPLAFGPSPAIDCPAYCG